MKSTLLSYLVQFILNFVFLTSKIRVHGEQHLKDSISSDHPTMICVWHGRFLYSIYFLQHNNYNVWALSSSHKDSEVLAQALQRWKVNLIRGSSTRGWKHAIVEMTKKLQNSENTLAITNDGPKGPPKIAKPGSVKLAVKYNANMITMTGVSSKYFEFKTWDKLRIPKPFSTIDIHISKPLSIDKDKIEEVGDVEYLSNFMNEFERSVDKKHSNG
tara:strand:+ start:560 stop:1204 length:645 start_codon:yes stop_codon:yes gene_type:complete